MRETHGLRDLKSALSLMVLDPKIYDVHGTNGLCTEYAARKCQNDRASSDSVGAVISQQQNSYSISAVRIL